MTQEYQYKKIFLLITSILILSSLVFAASNFNDVNINQLLNVTNSSLVSVFAGNISASYYIGDGSLLTGIIASANITAGTGINTSDGIANNISIRPPYRLPQNCNNGEIPSFNTTSSGWDCSSAGAGDITAINTDGNYLSGGAISGDISILWNETKGNNTYVNIDGDTMTGTLNISTANLTVDNNLFLVDATNDSIGFNNPTFDTDNFMRVNLPADKNILIDAQTTSHTGTHGAFRVKLDATIPNQKPMSLYSWGNGYQAVRVLNLNYYADGLSTGDGYGMVVNLDDTGATGGELDGIVFQSVDAVDAVTKHAIHIGGGYDYALHFKLGNPRNTSQSWLYNDSYINTTNAFNDDTTDINIFESNNDYIYIGNGEVFDEIHISLENFSTKDLTLIVEYSNDTSDWKDLSIADSTGGFRYSGIISYDAPSDWALGTVNGVSKYYVRIQRTRAGNVGTIIENTIKIVTLSDYYITGTSQIQFADGNITSPTYGFADDSNVGMYRISSDVLGFSTGGVERVRIDNDSLIVNGNVSATEFSGLMDWTFLQNYPTACPAGTFVTTNDDSNTCTAPTAADIDSGTFPAGNYVFTDNVTVNKLSATDWSDANNAIISSISNVTNLISSFQCAGNDQMNNVSITTSGITGVCTNQGAGAGMTNWILSNGSTIETINESEQVNITAGTGISIAQSTSQLVITNTEINTDTQWTIDEVYLNNVTGTLTFNGTKLNTTIDARDSDTTYSASVPYMILTGSAFSWNETEGNATYVNVGETAGGDLSGTYPNPSVVDDSHAHVVGNIDAATSATWAGQITDESGTGVFAFTTSPIFVTPTLGVASATTLDTGNGAYELFAMNQDVESTDAVTFATVNTGQGANELYDMDQDVLTTSDTIFNQVNVTTNISVNNGVLEYNGTNWIFN